MDHRPSHSAAPAKEHAENATEAENTRQETPDQEQANGGSVFAPPNFDPPKEKIPDPSKLT